MTPSTQRQIIIDLSISKEELLKLYRGSARQVVARSIDGLTVRFPAQRLQPFVGHTGVHGRFRLLIDDNNKLLDIESCAQGGHSS